MTSKDLLMQKKFIIQSISELEGSNLYLEEATQPIEPSVAIGRLSRMEAIGEKSVNEARHVNVKLRLEKLNNALNRIEQGTYGICVRCKKEIPLGRLQAVPESLICVPCAEKKK
ncbi:MAG: TraR/DksA C4-type zinc finger protein [Spirochaetaceae bacterium]|jgi:DnaK suppressor protein|nr:TraR/DksA C4-type zinc finger protein [Spirochaetaceae bacterium]